MPFSTDRRSATTYITKFRTLRIPLRRKYVFRHSGGTMKEHAGMMIGKLVKRSGVSPDAIRFYEDEGMLLSTDKTEAGYRLYTVPVPDDDRGG